MIKILQTPDYVPLDEKFDPLSVKGIAPGTRVMVFDSTLYKDDKKTPLSYTVRPAVVIRHYGLQAQDYGSTNDLVLGPYQSLVDVIFDHRPERVSKGHFTYSISVIDKESSNAKGIS